MIRRIIIAGLMMLTGLSAGERLHLGDERLAIEIATPLTDWIEKHGPRFETTAAVVSARVKGVEFLAVGGLADEFNPKWISPPGFDQSKPGEPFLKIGVGVLLRKSTWRYFFGHHYAVRRLAAVERLAVSDTTAAFRQRCDSGLGWAYDHEKTYSVDTAARTLVIHYRMKNTGEKPFTIEHYNHNWFAFPEPAGSGVAYTLQTLLPLEEGLTVAAPMSEPIYRMTERAMPASANRVTVRHATDGRWVEFTGDFAVSRFALAVDAHTFSPEVFGRWTLAPGEDATWSRTYRFGIGTDDES